MADTITIGDGTRVINGWWVNSARSSIQASVDSMPLPLQTSDQTFLMDYGGRERVVTLAGVLIDGNTLGTGDNFGSVTDMHDQISEIEAHFVNLDTVGTTFTLVRWSGDSGITGKIDSFDYTLENVVSIPFNLKFTEGVE